MQPYRPNSILTERITKMFIWQKNFGIFVWAQMDEKRLHGFLPKELPSWEGGALVKGLFQQLAHRAPNRGGGGVAKVGPLGPFPRHLICRPTFQQHSLKIRNKEKWIALHCMTLHCIPLCFPTPHYTTLLSITPYQTTPEHYSTLVHHFLNPSQHCPE